MKTFKDIKIIFMILAVILFSSCNIKINVNTGTDDKELYEWSYLNDAFYKQNTNSSTGQLCMVYENRIYYISDESGQAGVHSMDFEGNDIAFLLPCDKTTKMIIKDDVLYLLEQSLLSKTDTDVFYTLEVYDIKEDEVKGLPFDFFGTSVVDFMVCKNGEKFIVYMQEGEYPKNDILLYNCSDNNTENEKIAEKELTELKMDDITEEKIAVYDNYIVCINKYVRGDNYNSWREIGNSNDTVYNIETGETLMDETSKYNTSELRVLYTDEEYLYMGYNKRLLIYNRDTLDFFKEIFIDGLTEIEQIDCAFNAGDNMYFVLTGNNTLERIVALDLETYEHTEIIKSVYETDKKRLINIQGGCMLYVNKDKICYQELEGDGLGEMLFEISFEQDIDEGHLFETAGDWLFIHSRGTADDEEYELKYKINLITQDVIELE